VSSTRQVRVGKTKSRRVLASMNEAVLMTEAILSDDSRGPATLEKAEDHLAENLYSMLKYGYPTDVARELLGAPPRSRPRRPLATDPAPVPARDEGSRPAPSEAPEHVSAVDLLSLVLNGPPKKRTKIAEGQTVPVKLSARDRKLIIEHTMQPSSSSRSSRVKPKVSTPASGGAFSRGSVMSGPTIAAEANHCKSKKLQQELNGLYDRLKDVMEAFHDGGWQS